MKTTYGADTRDLAFLPVFLCVSELLGIVEFVGYVTIDQKFN
jgi:hypothetical protein